VHGKQKLYDNLISSSLPEAIDKPLSAQRDEALVHRFYFHAELERLRYDDCLLELHKTFFLSIEYLPKLLGKDENFNLLKRLTSDKPNLNDLRKRFPQFNWTVMRV